MRIAVLTSSRADYGIYLPLLKALKGDSFFHFDIIAFGTHTSPFHGYTLGQILKDGFRPRYCVESILAGDSMEAISTAIGLTQLKFSGIWQQAEKAYDLVFCLGDRYEMFAAVSAGIPFGIRFCHIHGGESTLGAIDDQFRHALSIFSSLHFVATSGYADRVASITGSTQNIHCVGALSLDNLETLKLYSKAEFAINFNIDLEIPTILVTFHPETKQPENNINAATELIRALEDVPCQIVITMPNADTLGASMRKIYQDASLRNQKFKCVENLGTKGYFTAMKYCKLLVGNSSSGIIEAASFHKYVLDLGNRQSGRATSQNTINAPVEYNSIRQNIYALLEKQPYNGDNIYYHGGATKQIIDYLKQSYV